MGKETTKKSDEVSKSEQIIAVRENKIPDFKYTPSPPPPPTKKDEGTVE
jgi:hypothetical protein